MSLLDGRARAIAARFRFEGAGAGDPAVRSCMQRYLAASGYPLDARSMADRWTRVNEGAAVVAVIGEKTQPDPRDLMLTDLYPGPGRKGIIGVYATVEVLKQLVESGRLNSLSWVSESANVRHNQALRRIFGVEPVAYFWRYGAIPVAGPLPEQPLEPPPDQALGQVFGLSGEALERVFQEVFSAP